MSRLSIILLLSLVLGCGEPAPPVMGEIVNVYREFKLGLPDGTTVVRLEDGTVLKYHGRLGKPGDKINVRDLQPIWR